MTEFFHAIQANPLLLTALMGGLLASVVSGMMGSYVVVKRIVMISGSIAHSVLGGIGFAIWLDHVHGITSAKPIYGALFGAIVSALIVGQIRLRYKEREDTVIAAIWSVGMALGIIFISQTPGFNVDLTNFLIGNILWITPEEVTLLIFLDLIVLATVLILHKRFLAVCFDEEQATLQGIRVNTLYNLLLVLISITIVLLIQVVGIVLVMTLLAIPAAIANMYTSRLSTMMIFSVIICALFSFFGMSLSFQLDWPSGATIAVIAGGAYLLNLLIKP